MLPERSSFNLAKGAWDPELLTLFGVPMSALPEVVASNEALGDATLGGDKAIPICGILGDSHAALLGHGVLARGKVKATYGTGSSLMTLCDSPQGDDKGISSTIAWKFDRIQYAYEGNITVTGSGLSWALALTGFKDLEPAVKLATELDGNGERLFCARPGRLGRAPLGRKGARCDRGFIIWRAKGTRGARRPGGDRFSGKGRV